MEETIVRLKLRSRIYSPEKLVELSGLNCQRSWRIGERRGKSGIVEEDNGCVVESGLPKSATLDEHMAALLAVLAPCTAQLRSLSEHTDIELSCVVYGKTVPALNFSRKTIDQIAGLGASLDIDLYVT